MPVALALFSCVLLSAPFAVGQGYPPSEAVKRMSLPEGFTAQAVAHEPMITQPVAIEFDDRGRLWVAQYIQYPNPAGLKRASVDRYSRTVYDRTPEPPPRGPKGADKITILEDRDNDGAADSAVDFVTGLNLASGLAFGRDGVFVLQPPYLLFYADRNSDDAPDGDPEVLLEGFGIEDAHSVANSLTWGPDGWLYGCQGSTVTARVRGVEFQQGVWRYHPVTREFELFCEGGGNSWGLDFDDDGELFYSTNLGGYRMLHGVQGGYYWKLFGKHGALHNPHAYGHFEHVPYRGFTGGHVAVGGLIYRGGAFPDSFRGKHIAGDLLGHSVQWHDLAPNGASFTASHGGQLLTANDTWFATSDVTTGPDGAIYVADWHDQRTAHPDPDAEWDRSNGRVYRIAWGQGPRRPTISLADLSSSALIQLLTHKNEWHSRRARRLLAERRDPTMYPQLIELARTSPNDRLALEAIWALHGAGGFSEDFGRELLKHRLASARKWAVRLLGDSKQVSLDTAQALVALAETESDARTRAQLASSAKRLPAEAGLAIASALLRRDLDAGDPHIPLLLWWAVEAHSMSAMPAALTSMLDDRIVASKLGRETVLPRLLRRYASDGGVAAEIACARILAKTLASSRGAMLEALELGLRERSPESRIRSSTLREAILANWTDGSLDEKVIRLAVRCGHSPAAARALALAAGPAPEELRRSMFALLADSRVEEVAPICVRALRGEEPEPVSLAALDALRAFPGKEVSLAVLNRYARLKPAERAKARDLLLSRPSWARVTLAKVEAGSIPREEFSPEQLQAVARHGDAEMDARARKLWGNVTPGTTEEKLAVVRRFRNDLNAGAGDIARGQVLFRKHCAACHQLHGEGKAIGPDLTHANRADREFLLASIVDPSSVIRREYLAHYVETKDGQVMAGLMVGEVAGQVTLLAVNGERLEAPRDRIAAVTESSVSLMPEGLLEPMTPQERRDLFAYLQSPKPERSYLNQLTLLSNPPALLADYPDWVEPVREVARFEAPPLVDDPGGELSVRAWRFSYHARGVVEMPNRLNAKETAVIMVHPWGIDDGQGWNTPEPAGAADFCTKAKNALAGRHTREVIDPFLKKMRPLVGAVMLSLPHEEDPIRRKLYRSIRRKPTEEERKQGEKELAEKLAGLSYRAGPLPETISLDLRHPTASYFEAFPGLRADDHFNGDGFWDQPIPVTKDITLFPDDVVIYDGEGYEPLKGFLLANGIRHVLLTGYATDMCFCQTTAGYRNLSQDFNVFLVGDASLATFPANSSPRFATNAAISFAALTQLVTQISWVRHEPTSKP